MTIQKIEVIVVVVIVIVQIIFKRTRQWYSTGTSLRGWSCCRGRTRRRDIPHSFSANWTSPRRTEPLLNDNRSVNITFEGSEKSLTDLKTALMEPVRARVQAQYRVEIFILSYNSSLTLRITGKMKKRLTSSRHMGHRGSLSVVRHSL